MFNERNITMQQFNVVHYHKMSYKNPHIAKGDKMATKEKKVAAIADAVTKLLSASDLDLKDKDLLETPKRVAELWINDILSGYEMNPAEILSEVIDGENDPDSIFINDLSFHSMCPHHLLPYRGRVHIAYIPNGKLAGFGQLAQLVECFTRRLTLQERATHKIAEAIMIHLGAKGAACVIEAEHMCLSLPNDQHEASHLLTSSFLGEFKNHPELQQQFFARLGECPNCNEIDE